MRKLIGKIGAWLRGKKKPAPRKYGAASEQRGPGHRGIAAGSLQRRHDLQEAGEQPYSQEEISKWQTLTGNQIEDFIYNQELLVVNSSNVASAQYFIDDMKMIVHFLSGGAYIYSNVTEDEAHSFTMAQSKGGWIWDTLRVRGSRTAHRKPYQKLGG